MRINHFLVFFVTLVLTGCVSVGNTRFSLNQRVFADNYPSIKSIVVEEAANNGFGALTSEIKPSEFSEWKGKLFFQLKTANGTDQLFVEFGPAPEGVSVYVHGAGTRSNPDSASKAIRSRLERTFGSASVQIQAKVAPLTPDVGSSKSSAPAQPNQKPIEVSTPSVDPSQMSPADAQERLITLGYLNGKADGIFGTNSVRALVRFQKKQGIPASGRLDAQTTARLRSASKK